MKRGMIFITVAALGLSILTGCSSTAEVAAPASEQEEDLYFDEDEFFDDYEDAEDYPEEDADDADDNAKEDANNNTKENADDGEDYDIDDAFAQKWKDQEAQMPMTSFPMPERAGARLVLR